MSALLLSPEASFLLRRVCAPNGGADGAAVATGAPAPDWLALAQLAAREKLLGVLWPALTTVHDAIPDDVARAMRRQALVSEFRMTALEGQLRAVVALLAEHGIPVMLMKGSALAVTAYGSFARRPMGDLDLLIRESQVQAAWDLLRGAGWTREVEGADSFYSAHQHLCPLVAPGRADIVVELHRTLLYPKGPFHLSERDVWDAARSMDLGGLTVWVPAPAHLVLHICVHFAWLHEMRSGLARTVRDLAVVSPFVDWHQVLELARATSAQSCCYWTLHLASRLGGVPVPSDVLAALAPHQPKPLLRALDRVLTAQSLDPRPEFMPSLQLAHMVWELAIRPAAAGHSAIRPWELTADFAKLTHAPPPRSLAGRLGDQLSRAPNWLRFLAVAAGVERGPARKRTPRRPAA